MLKYYAQISEQGFLVGVSQLSEEVEVDNLMPITDEEYQTLFDRFYKPKYVNEKWVEGATPEEINAIENPPEPVDIISELESENAELWYEIMRKDAHDSEQDREIATIWYELMTGGVA